MEGIDEHIDAIIRYVQEQPNAAQGAAEATAAGTRIQKALVPAVAQLRAAYYRQLAAENWTMEEIAELCGLTRSRVEQVLNR